eukprot:gene2266-2985_t
MRNWLKTLNQAIEGSKHEFDQLKSNLALPAPDETVPDLPPLVTVVREAMLKESEETGMLSDFFGVETSKPLITISQPNSPIFQKGSPVPQKGLKRNPKTLHLTKPEEVARSFQMLIMEGLSDLQQGLGKVLDILLAHAVPFPGVASKPSGPPRSASQVAIEVNAAQDQLRYLELESLEGAVNHDVELQLSSFQLEDILVACVNDAHTRRIGDEVSGIYARPESILIYSAELRSLLLERGPTDVKRAISTLHDMWLLLVCGERLRLNKIEAGSGEFMVHETVSRDLFRSLQNEFGEVGLEFYNRVFKSFNWSAGDSMSKTQYVECVINFIAGGEVEAATSRPEGSMILMGTKDKYLPLTTRSFHDMLKASRRLVTKLLGRRSARLVDELYTEESMALYEQTFIRVTGSLAKPLRMHQISLFLQLQFPDFCGQHGISDGDAYNVVQELHLLNEDQTELAEIPWTLLSKQIQKCRKEYEDKVLSEDKNQLHVGNGILNPSHWAIQRVWRPIMLYHVVYSFFMVPFRIAFQPFKRVDQPMYLIFELFPDLLMLLDAMIVNFSLAYFNKDSLFITDRAKISRHYVANGFVIDMCAALPFDLFALGMGSNMYTASLMRLPKLLRLRNLLVSLKASLSKNENNATKIKRLLYITAGILHLTACVWFSLGQNSGHTWYTAQRERIDALEEDTMAEERIPEPQLGFGDKDTVFEKYLLSFYWVTVTISSSGRVGNMLPVNFSEIAFVIAIMFLNITLFSYLLGEMSNIVLAADEKLMKDQEQMIKVQTFLTSRQLPNELQEEVKKHFHVSRNGEKHQDMAEITSLMSHTLQVEVAKCLSRNFISDVRLLKGCGDNFMDSLSVLLRENQFPPTTVVFREAEVCRELVFVVSGSVQIVVNTDEEGDLVVETVNSGESAGDLAFFFGMRHFTSARVSPGMNCVCFVLQRFDFVQLLKLYPSEEELIAHNALHSFTEYEREAGSHYSQSQGGSESGRSHGTSASRDSGSKMLETLEVSGMGDAIKMLRSKRANDNLTRLFEAARRASESVFKESLLKTGLDVDATDGYGRTSLHVAASEGNLGVIRHLLEQGASVNIKDSHGNTPLNEAVLHVQEEACAIFRKHDPKLALDMREVDAAVKLCEAGAKGDLVQIQRFVQNGVNLNWADYDSRTCLHLASAEGQYDVVKFLLEQGADVKCLDRFGGTPLEDAIRHKKYDVQKLLVKNGGTIGQMDLASKMCEAAASDDVPTLEILIACGVHPNSTDYNKRTALHLAASMGADDVIDFLLHIDPPIDRNPIDRWGGTPLEDAYRHQNEVAIVMLEVAGALRSGHSDLMRETEEKQKAVWAQVKNNRRSRVRKMVEECSEAKDLTSMRDIEEKLEDSFNNAQQANREIEDRLAICSEKFEALGHTRDNDSGKLPLDELCSLME